MEAGRDEIVSEAYMRRGTSDSAKVCLVKCTTCAPFGVWLSFAAAIAASYDGPPSRDEASSPYLAAAPRPL